jgi:hypothetical protein
MSPITLAAWQCLLGGLGLGVLSALVESAGLADVARLASWPVWPALAFLVLGGSLVGFAVYLKLCGTGGRSAPRSIPSSARSSRSPSECSPSTSRSDPQRRRERSSC